MSLDWSIGGIENFKEVCYDTRTREEVESQGLTIEALLEERGFLGSHWYIPGVSETEKLANCDVIERLRQLTSCLVWSTIGVGMRSITEENHVEFWVRLGLREKIKGALLHEQGDDGKTWKSRHITLEEVKRHIGLTTNASEVSWALWGKNMLNESRSAALRREGLPVLSLFREESIALVAQDTREQVTLLDDALLHHAYDEGRDEEEELRQSEDSRWVRRALSHLDTMCDGWAEIEERKEEEEEREAEEAQPQPRSTP